MTRTVYIIELRNPKLKAISYRRWGITGLPGTDVRPHMAAQFATATEAWDAERKHGEPLPPDTVVKVCPWYICLSRKQRKSKTRKPI